MVESKLQPRHKRSAIVDALVLACVNTKLTDVVGPDAMQTA